MEGRTYAIFQDARPACAAKLAVQIRRAAVADMLFRGALSDPEAICRYLRRQAEARAEESLQHSVSDVPEKAQCGYTDLAALAVANGCASLIWGL